jgi:HK97 family phage major capsid protein
MNSKDLREKRAKLVADARAIVNNRRSTAEDVARAERMLSEAGELKTRIDVAERVDSAYASLSQEIRRHVLSDGAGFVSDPARDKALLAKLTHGNGGSKNLTDYEGEYLAATVGRDRRILAAMSKGELRGLSPEDQAHYTAHYRAPQVQNAGSTTSTTGGGFTVAPLFEAQLLIALKAFGGVRAAARTLTTPTGATLPWPTLDDTGNAATILGENTAVGAGADLTFGQTAIGAFTYVSGVMPVSLQLIQDAVFDFDSLIESAMALRFARGQNAHFTCGNGISQPQGVATGATLCKTGAAGQTTSVLWTDFLDLEHSVDPAYRKGATWMFNDTVLKAAATFKDGLGRPLWQAGLEVGAPDTLLGYPYTVNQDMPLMVPGARSILFGDFSQYLIRDALGLQIMVLRERYADQLQVAWSAFTRADGRLISAAQPIKFYQNSLS